jgi:hypothetical protein
MRIRFFADDHNARFVWTWIDGQYETDNPSEIEHLKGIGLRWEEVESSPIPADDEKKTRKPRRK